MSKFFRLLFVGALVMLSFGACSVLDPCGSSATGFADKASNFFADARSKDFAASDDAWARYDDRLVELVEVCYPEHELELTKAQDRAFWKAVANYHVHRYGRAGAKGFLRKLNRGVQDKLKEAGEALEQAE